MFHDTTITSPHDVAKTPLLWALGTWDPYEQFDHNKRRALNVHNPDGQSFSVKFNALETTGNHIVSDRLTRILDNGITVKQTRILNGARLKQNYDQITGQRRPKAANFKYIMMEIGFVDENGTEQYDFAYRDDKKKAILDALVAGGIDRRDVRTERDKITLYKGTRAANIALNALTQMQPFYPLQFQPQGALDRNTAHTLRPILERDVIRNHFVPIFNTTGNVVGIYRPQHFAHNGYGLDIMGHFDHPVTYQEFESTVCHSRSNADTMQLVSEWKICPFTINRTEDADGNIGWEKLGPSTMSEDAFDQLEQVLRAHGTFMVDSSRGIGDADIIIQSPYENPADEVDAILKDIKALPPHKRTPNKYEASYFMAQADEVLGLPLFKEPKTMRVIQGTLFRGKGRRNPVPRMPDDPVERTIKEPPVRDLRYLGY